jgi:hypothetical protein
VQGAIGASCSAGALAGQLGILNAPLATIGTAFHQK